MAGPSNTSYTPGAQCLNLMGSEEPSVDESLQSTPGVVEADEGVEVIMVDDPQPEHAEKRPAGPPEECSGEPRCVLFSALGAGIP